MNPSTLTTLPPNVLARALKSLSYREREILKLIAGVGDGFRYTSVEVAQIFKLSPAAIEALVEKAMLKVEQRLLSRVTKDDDSRPEASGINVTLAVPEYCDEHALAEKLFELCVALNGMHIGAGGSGLIVNDDQTFSGVATLEGTPVQ